MKKLSDNIVVNGEQRFFVASEVTDDLLEKLKTEIHDGGITEIEAGSSNVHVTMSQDGKKATISVDGSTFVTTQNNFAEILAIVNAGNLPVLRHEFADGDVWFLSLREVDTDINYMIFSGPAGSSGVFAYAELTTSGWTAPRTYRMASHDALRAEAQTRSAADTSLQEQIDENHIDIDDALSTESTNPVENRAVACAVNSKQDQIPQEQLDEMTDQEIDDLMASLT